MTVFRHTGTVYAVLCLDLGVADLSLCCELNLGIQISSFYFRGRHRKHRQGSAPDQIQTLRHPGHRLYTVQTHWRQHHWKRKRKRKLKSKRRVRRVQAERAQQSHLQFYQVDTVEQTICPGYECVP